MKMSITMMVKNKMRQTMAKYQWVYRIYGSFKRPANVSVQWQWWRFLIVTIFRFWLGQNVVLIITWVFIATIAHWWGHFLMIAKDGDNWGTTTMYFVETWLDRKRSLFSYIDGFSKQNKTKSSNPNKRSTILHYLLTQTALTHPLPNCSLNGPMYLWVDALPVRPVYNGSGFFPSVVK
jgi:hypothetical protein